MVFKDQLVRCGACGKTFVYTVREQRYRADRGLSTEAPVFCMECRGADVRLAEAVERPGAPDNDEPGSQLAPDARFEDRPAARQREAGQERDRDGFRDRARAAAPAGTAVRPDAPRAGRGDTRGSGRRDRSERTGLDDDRGRGRGRGGPRPPQRRGPVGGGPGRGRSRTEGSRQTELRLRHFGTVKWFDREKGFGFIAQDDGGEVFVHMTGVIAGAHEGVLQEGQPVEYEVERTTRGLQAVDVVALA